jgi:hypothetical protein
MQLHYGAAFFLLDIMCWYIYIPGRDNKTDIMISENRGIQNSETNEKR